MSAQMFKAVEFAANAHRGQYRKGTEIPYIVHPLAVCRILLSFGLPEPLGIAALLHDVVEDTPVTIDEVRREFGELVALLVEGASEPDKGASWEERKQHTLHFLDTANEDVLLISVADKLDNLEGIRDDLERDGVGTWTRFSRGPEQQKLYFQGLSGIYRRRLLKGPGKTLASRFERAVSQVFP